MAKMFPKEFNADFITFSEREFYLALQNQLNDNYHVFYSVNWITNSEGDRINSECDFLIFNNQLGYLTIEVKGGKKICFENGEWRLYSSKARNEKWRVLKESPFKQSNKSMYYFKEQFFNEYKYKFKGIYGSAVAFPLYNIDFDELPSEANSEITIDYSDMDRLSQKINDIFHFWKSNSYTFNTITSRVRKDFLNLVNKKISYSIAAGALIEYKNKKLNAINKVQDYILDFLKNYKQVIIKGGAGTGKTWIAMKKALRISKKDKKVLFLMYNNNLMKFIRNKIGNNTNIEIYTFHKLVKKIIGKEKFLKIYKNNKDLEDVDDIILNYEFKKYDGIVIDEAQDFTENWGFVVKNLLKKDKESYFYVFYDPDQNIFNRNMENNYFMDNKEFVLTKNLRNTKNIYKWIKKRTGLGKNVKNNSLIGVSPNFHSFTKKSNAKIHLENLINRFLKNENVKNESIIILSNVRKENSILKNTERLSSYKIVEKSCDKKTNKNEIKYSTLHNFKGLEADIVIYLKHQNKYNNTEKDYVAFTRAKYYLIIFNLEI